MKKKFYQPVQWLLIVLLGIFSLSFAADKVNYLNIFYEAEAYFSYDDYTEALPLYNRVLEKYPDNHYLFYKIGRCLLNIPYAKSQSIQYLQKACLKTPLVIKPGSFKADKVPYDAIFYLADAYRVNNELEKAISTYKNFLNTADQEVFDINLVNDQISACARAMIMEKHPVVTNEVNLGNIINSRFSETSPVVSNDETVMVYAVNLQFYQAVYYSKKINGQWSVPENIIPDLKVDGDCLPVCISSDGKELYFYRFDKSLGDLYVSNRVNDKWSKIRKLNSNINTKYWESHACLTTDGKILYFSSNRPGGYGGLDIYKSERTSDDNWGPAINCGPVINSKYNDDAPYLTSNDKRLFLSSFGHETMGGYDIFYSDKDSSGSWGKIINPGFPVNTTDDEMFICPVNSGKSGYIYKFDLNGQGKYDICRIDIPEIAKTNSATATKVNSIIDSVFKKGKTNTNPSFTDKVDVLDKSGVIKDKKLVSHTRIYNISSSSIKSGEVKKLNIDTITKATIVSSKDSLEDKELANPKNIDKTTTQSTYLFGLSAIGCGALYGGIILLFLLIIAFYLKRKKNN